MYMDTIFYGNALGGVWAVYLSAVAFVTPKSRVTSVGWHGGFNYSLEQKE